MQNHPLRNRTPGVAQHHPLTNGKNVHSRKKKFATFLRETEIWPLVLAGRCVEQFGLGTVAGFVLGAACVYGYAVFKILPGSKAAVAPPEHTTTVSPAPPKTVVLHGMVKSHQTQFEIGILSIRRGPFQPDGSYSIEVPESDRYLVVGWYPDYSKFKMQDMAPDKSGALQDLVFPTTDMSTWESPVKNHRNGASDNYALADHRKSGAKDGAAITKNF
jgi:hypothetical protein